MRTTAIVLAAGEGRRIGGNTSKIFLPLAGRALLLRTLDRVFAARAIDNVVVVVAAHEIGRCESLLRSDAAFRGLPWLVQDGGATRRQSAKRGLEKIAAGTDLVMIHDGARPFVSAGLIDRCVDVAAEKSAVVVGLPARDTIKFVSQDRWIQSTPERSLLWEVQTPQVFKRELILEAHARADEDGLEVTDDALLVERLGKPVFIIEGERTNLKITVPEDIWVAEALIREQRVA
jgi:2-C-methyl-D-erythritol 4-phosphate cytidylyltransferase/2-C-methyl-D-erythritol 4-phosphate cytidylyltransferase/2-C-methyl-D-erythritol 2,4-cyclodiphosphate synthase